MAKRLLISIVRIVSMVSNMCPNIDYAENTHFTSPILPIHAFASPFHVVLTHCGDMCNFKHMGSLPSSMRATNLHT